VAEDLTSDVRAAAPVEEPLAVRRRPGESVSVFRRRFALAYLALAVLAGLGVGATVLLIDRPEEKEVLWSNWRPIGSEGTFDDQIGDYVGARYRLPSGNPLAAVIPGPPTIVISGTELTVSNVVISDDPEGDRDGFRVVKVANSRMYQLCGLGQQCSMGEGSPSEARMRLLRREALELALYTFKYTGDTDTVITLLPPNLGKANDPDDDTAVALFFERRALRNELEQPLRKTLLSPNPPQAAELDAIESLVIERLTGNRLFLYQFRPDLAGGALMLLARVG
jgi:hypothetical protein